MVLNQSQPAATAPPRRRNYGRYFVGAILAGGLVLPGPDGVDRALGQPLARRARNRGTQPRPTAWPLAVRDAFFADVIGELGPLIPTDPPTPTGVVPLATAPEPPPPVAGHKPSLGWSAEISSAALENEIKSQALLLGQLVAAAGDFRAGKFVEARASLNWLAALFQVVAEYDGTVRWQASAAAAGHDCAQAALACSEGSAESLARATQIAEGLAELLQGNPWRSTSDAAAPAATRPDRRGLMAQLERADKEWGPWVASARDFSRQRAALAEGSERLKLLSRWIVAEGYEYADDPTFRQGAERLHEAADGLGRAVSAGDLEGAGRAWSAVRQSCTDCHRDYRS